MEHKNQVAMYLSGDADLKAQRQTEDGLLRDTALLERFIEAVGQELHTVSADFANTVMRLLPHRPEALTPVPTLSRRMWATVCFCSAAVIMLFTLSGLDTQVLAYLTASSGKLSEWLSLLQKLTIGG